MTAKIIALNNRAARRRLHNREVEANAKTMMAVILHARRAVKRDGTVGGIKQAAFCEPSESNKAAAIAKLLDWAYNYGGSKESEDSGIGRILSPAASVLYLEILNNVEAQKRAGAWARLFDQLKRDGVTFLTEERTIGTGPTETR